MNRRTLVGAVAGALLTSLLATPPSVDAQSTENTRRIGFLASLARPGSNVTGGSFSVGIDIIGKQLQLLKEAFPRASSVAILVNPTNPGHALILDKMKADAKSLGLSLHLLEARAPDEFD